MLVTVFIGLSVTVAATLISLTQDRHNERRLLQIQTRQAAAVIGSQVVGIASPLESALQIAAATRGNPQAFTQALAASTGPKELFVSVSLWQTTSTSPRRIVAVGAPPDLSPSSLASTSFLTKALASKTFVVTSINAAGQQRIGYAAASATNPRFLVYAERSIPANRQVPIESNAAFADLDYATYLGPNTTPSALATTDLPPRQLPLKGDVAREVIPLGDTDITLIAAAHGHLGGSLGYFLPWAFLIGGLLLTVTAALAAHQLVSQRRTAEHNSETITGLYGELDTLYQDQHSIAETLQRALLPAFNPEVPGLEIASRYVAGAAGVDIGGDWYSLIPLEEGRFAFVVGDVSGRGVSAATIMARLRFTMRAYLFEGHAPEVVLEMCSRQFDIETDGHFATVIVGIGDLNTQQVTVANAGHLNPLVVSGADARFFETEVGLPLGIAPSTYVAQSFAMAAGSTLLCYTDGLVERRGESIDAGLERLARSAAVPEETAEGLVTRVLTELTSDGAEDDLAILAIKWLDPASGSTG